jgi:peptidyl-dipeptidase A
MYRPRELGDAPFQLTAETQPGDELMTGTTSAAAVVVVAFLIGCAPATPPAGPAPAAPTAAEATAFVERAQAELAELSEHAARMSWVQNTYITHDTELLAAQAFGAYLGRTIELAGAAARFDGVALDYDTRRKLDLLKFATEAPAPGDPAATAEMSQILTRMESTYGRGEYCPPGGGECLDIGALSRILATERDPERLLMAWTGWRTISRPMRGDYERFAQLGNQGARELGFADLGAMWRSNWDMEPDAFAIELDRLWDQVRPLYVDLHCHVRHKLGEHYGFDLVPPGRPMPAHLQGNMWSQSWGNIYELVAPPAADPGYDLTEIIRARNMDAVEMTRVAEHFFTSLGLDSLPQTFWERSMFVQPRDRNVVCHASAWNIDDEEDLRIKMCIEQTAEDFGVIHHELGHNFYQRAYNHLPWLYRGSANQAFHEALGDAVALSVTPSYLVRLGYIQQEPAAAADLGLLMRDALDKIAFLPFGLLVDQWRWRVFAGEINPANYNAGWWELRTRYQGIEPPVARSEADFDPGAKFHVPANYSYTRYFLARILQFQFHRELCALAGYQGPLHRCTIYGNQDAGRRLNAMMQMGLSRPWPDALETLTGSREMDATAILDYFAPLHAWLRQENQGRTCGW